MTEIKAGSAKARNRCRSSTVSISRLSLRTISSIEAIGNHSLAAQVILLVSFCNTAWPSTPTYELYATFSPSRSSKSSPLPPHGVLECELRGKGHHRVSCKKSSLGEEGETTLMTAERHCQDFGNSRRYGETICPDSVCRSVQVECSWIDPGAPSSTNASALLSRGEARKELHVQVAGTSSSTGFETT